MILQEKELQNNLICKVISLHMLFTSDDTYYTPRNATNFIWFNVKSKTEKRIMLAFGFNYNSYQNQNHYNKVLGVL